MIRMDRFPKLSIEIDDTPRIQRAADAARGKTLFFPNKGSEYLISRSIQIDPTTRVLGESRSVMIRNRNPAQYAFVVQNAAPANVNQAEGFERLWIQSRFGIKLNQDGNYATVWSKQPVLFQPYIKHCYFEGDYGPSKDPDYNTSNVPAVEELSNYGIAVWGAKLFSLRIESNFFTSYGIPVYLEGCDLASISNNRFSMNAIAVFLGTKRGNGENFGSQCEIVHNEIITNKRRGQIVIPDGDAHTIVDNFFEADAPACEFIRIFGDFSHNIVHNRFNVSRTAAQPPTTPLMTIDVGYGSVVSHNRCNHKDFDFQIDILSSRYKTYRGNPVLEARHYILWTDNSSTFPIPNHPLVRTKEVDRHLFNAQNPRFLSNRIALNGLPWEKSAVTSNWTLKASLQPPVQSNIAADFIMDRLDPTTTAYDILFKGTRLDRDGYYEIRDGQESGPMLASGKIIFPPSGELGKQKVSLTVPQGTSRLFFRLIVHDGTAETNSYEEIRLIPKE